MVSDHKKCIYCYLTLSKVTFILQLFREFGSFHLFLAPMSFDFGILITLHIPRSSPSYIESFRISTLSGKVEEGFHFLSNFVSLL